MPSKINAGNIFSAGNGGAGISLDSDSELNASTLTVFGNGAEGVVVRSAIKQPATDAFWLGRFGKWLFAVAERLWTAVAASLISNHLSK
jgi:hypothetical protein